VIPDDSLHLLPLAALVTDLPEERMENFEQLADKYLIHHLPISYAYSATLWAEEPMDMSVGRPLTFLAISPETHPFTSTGYVGADVDSLQTLFSIQQLRGQAATKRALQRIGKDIGILHIASHGRSEGMDPMNAYLELHPDSADDGHLHAWEIYQLELPAQLVVLAACESGKGEVLPGEGVMSLARAFTYAGCPSLLTSLWNAESPATRSIMVPFYQGLKQGQPTSLALQQATVDYLQGQESRYQKAPYFWANYVLIGDNASIQIQSNRSIWPWVGMLLLLLSGVLLLLRRKGK
ncbi:MAG: CHAT domain-containing protein, partial [Bacteroidota bacterium]